MLHYIEYTIAKPSSLLHNQSNEQIYCLNSKLILMQFPSSLFIAGESLLPLPPRRPSFLSGVKCSSQFTLSICHSNMPQALAPSNTHTHTHIIHLTFTTHTHTHETSNYVVKLTNQMGEGGHQSYSQTSSAAVVAATSHCTRLAFCS